MNAFDRTDAVAELKTMAGARFEEASAMPKSVYTSEAFLAEELARIFRKDWVCVGRVDALPEPGDYLTYDLAGEPILVLRDREGRLRAMSNVCRHRMSTLLEGSGNVRAITCPYHAWTYNLDGTLRGAPVMTRNEAFRREDCRLPLLRCEEWLGWIMVTLDPDAAPVAEALAEVEGLIAQYGLENYTQTFSETHVWDTNWKVLAENFMESYHLPVCHAATVGGLSKLEEMDCPPGLPAFNYHFILKDDTLDIALAHPTNTRLTGDWRRTTTLLSIYPGLMITLTPGYFWYLVLHPRGVGRVHITYGGGMSPEFVNDPKSQEHFARLKTLLDAVNAEDKGCTEAVYRGLCSALARPGRLSHLERPIYDFANYLASRMP